MSMPALPRKFWVAARTVIAFLGGEPRHGSPQGRCLISDIRKLLPGVRFKMIFDVGANRGQTAIPMAKAFRSATIHCFEPSSSTYKQLLVACRRIRRIKAHPFALGESGGRGQLVLTEISTRRHLSAGDSNGMAMEAVEISTIDDFCARNCIDRIDFLKIDTEGHDLHALRGGARMLAAGKIGVIVVEAGFGPDNTTHVAFSAVSEELGLHGYQIFGFYEQMHEWKLGRPNLRRANVAFISAELCSQGPAQSVPSDSTR